MNNNIIQNNKSKPPSRSHFGPSKSPSPDVANPRRQTKANTANPIISQSKKYSVHDEMEKMKQRREERKKRIEDEKRSKLEMLNNPDFIAKLDYEYERMIAQKKQIIEQNQPEQHINSDNSKIFVCVRKRPIFQKEIQEGEIDCISAINPKVSVYDCKMKIDGITKYIDINDFYFDNVFHESEDTETLYECSVKPAINLLLLGGVVTCFAYGQTGSGKTFTMKGIQDLAIDSLFDAFDKSKTKNNKFEFYVSFFEIYSGRLYDLLNNRNKVSALEDKNQKVQIFGLEEKHVQTAQQMKDIVEFANTMRTTHNTVTNETSSRSHAICNVSYIIYAVFMQFVIKEKGKDEYAKLTLVDLAGSERATETQSNNKSRLAEGAEINKSLLALKECIRALDVRKTTGNNEQHVPFRTSKLTLVLRDSFISKSNISKIIMISCISPGYSSANHTINTLRYSDRLKEITHQVQISKNNPNRKQINQNTNININPFEIKNEKSLTSNNISTVLLNDDDLVIEDNMQKLNLGPTPIAKLPVQQLQIYNKSKYGWKNNKYKAQNNGNNRVQSAIQQERTYDDEVNYINNDNISANNHKSKLKNDDLIKEEDIVISKHMNIIKEDAKMLTEEGNLISLMRGINNESVPMEEYALKLNNIIDKKLEYFMNLKEVITLYKKSLKEENNL